MIMSLSPNKPPHQNPTFSQEIGPGDVHVRQQSCAEQKPKSDKKVRKSKSTEFINKTSDKEIEISAGSGENCVENLKAGASSCNGISNDRNYQEREKVCYSNFINLVHI
ncbi:hypothetical protein NQ314_014723 [Rhamnusium bicolor]|uniref:Uncharacterized protein n=1 Tax=Rhamnusium bicolor TaxID=1586634 RepID=A0AAV8X198_9CUCU|nr:hypothetical protein NQ314_014723 [Rhamnusium bicolor]